MILELRTRLRRLLHSPTYIVAVVLSLGLGTSVTLAALSIVNSLVFRPLPGISDRRDLIRVQWTPGATSLTNAEFAAVESQPIQSFTALAAQGMSPLPVMLPAGPEALPVAFVSSHFFAALGTRPTAGRLLDSGDATPDAAPVALLSEQLWRRAFNGDHGVLGRALVVGGRAFAIVGVTPDGFSGLRIVDIGERASDAPQVWLELRDAGLWPATARPRVPWLFFGGRLSDGTTLQAVRAELDVIARRIATATAPAPGESLDRTKSAFRAYRAGLDWRDEPSQSLLTMALFLFMPLCVLAIGCVNVINLQLARGMDEASELSLRLALGASRARILCLLLLEVACLATICAGLGILGARVLLSRAGVYLAVPPAIDGGVLTFTVLLVIAVVCVAGVLPAWQTSRDLVAAGLREFHGQSKRRVRLRSALVILQVAASVALLALSGVAIRSLMTMTSPMAVDAGQIVTADFDFTQVRPAAARSGLFVESVLGDLARAPSVRAAAFATFVIGGAPLRYWRETDPPAVERTAYGGGVTPGWFDATGASFIAGQVDRFVQGSAVVNRALAAAIDERGAGHALGARLRIGPATYVDVVGVVPDTLRGGDGTAMPMLFLPMPAVTPPVVSLIVRAADVTGAREAIRAAVTAADSSVPIVRMETLEARVSQLSKGVRAIVSLAAAIGLVSIGVAGAGLHSLLSYTVRRRKREIGIRVALGARTNEIIWLVTAPVVWLVTAGAAVGLAAAIPTAALIRSALVGASSIDARGLLPSVAILLGVALIAVLGPMLHAARVDPIQCLRDE